MAVCKQPVQTSDGLSLSVYRWLPEAEPAAGVVLVHGFTEHASRYADAAETLARHEYAVHAMDLRGHGRSEGSRVFVPRFERYLDDLDLLLARARNREHDKPLFLFGHSMGGAIATLYAIDRQPDLAGLVLSAPSVQVGGNVFPLLRRLASLFSWLAPRLRVVRMGFQYLSRDPGVLADFRDDPLVFHGRFPARTGAEILRASRRIQATMDHVRLPLFILHGTGDAVVDPDGSRRLYARAQSPDKTLKLYPGLFHDLLHEPERGEVLADIVSWLDHRTQQPPTEGPSE